MKPVDEILAIESNLKRLARNRALAADDPEYAELIDLVHHVEDERRMALRARLSCAEDLALELQREENAT